MNERLHNIVMRRDMVGGETKAGQSAKLLRRRLRGYGFNFGEDATSTHIAPKNSGWYRIMGEGAKKRIVDYTNAPHANEISAVLPLELPPWL